jgi:hypothetical protein
MAKWKLFGKSKSKEESECEELVVSESKQKSKKPILAEYNEKLYSEGAAPKKHFLAQKKSMETDDQRVWRDLKSIEKNVDNIDKDEAQKPARELDKAVDRILFKRKRK